MSEPRTRYVEIACKSVLNRVRGMPFEWSINPYRGCAHRCVFCYARRTHTFYELDGIDDWGSTIFVKLNAPEVLRRELAASRWSGNEVAIGTATDPYQAAEAKYGITRSILIELARARTRAHLITRSPSIARDVDVLRELSRAAGISVCFSIPTLDASLARAVEPTVATPAQRLRALSELAAAGIRVGVAIAPVLPFLSDGIEQLRAVYEAAAEAGASFAWTSVLNLGEVARDSYAAFLAEKHPELTERYAASTEADMRARATRTTSTHERAPRVAESPSIRRRVSSPIRRFANSRCFS